MISVTTINGVTKETVGNTLRYYFNEASVYADTGTGVFRIIPNRVQGFEVQVLDYATLTETFGTSTLEEYLDYFCTNGFFLGNNTVTQISQPLPYIIAVERGLIAGESIVDKFGYNPDIDTGSTPESVWYEGGEYTGFPTGPAEQMEVLSNNGQDTAGGAGARTVLITNLLDGNGAPQPDVTVTLNGTTPVSLGAGLYSRCTRMRVLEVGSDGYNRGTITLRHATTTSNVFATMPPQSGRTQIAAYTVPAGFELEVLDVVASLVRSNGSAGSARVAFRQRRYDDVLGTWLSWEDTPRTAISNGFNYQKVPNYPVPIPARTDIEVFVEDVSDNNSQVSAEFFGILRAV